MKTKIISLLAVVALVVAMAVPVFASADSYELSGIWMFNESLKFEDMPVRTEVSLQFVSNGNEYTAIGVIQSSYKYELWFNNTRYYVQYQWNDNVSRIVDFGTSPQTVSKEFYEWFVANAVKQVCDGSTCPATDVNQDNVCDDCGMTFAVLRDYGPPDPYTVWTEERQLTYPYALIYTNNSGDDFLILSKQPATFEDGVIVFRETNHVIYTVFGTSWNLHQSYDEAYTSYGNIAEVYPSYNMRNEAGQIAKPYNGDFFPLPLWSQMEMVTQGEMVQLTQTTVGAMATLALCGVGLLALLMGLFLFSKRSILFPRG